MSSPRDARVATFVAAWAGSPTPAQEAALGAALAELVARARRDRPALVLDDADEQGVIAHLAGHVDADADPDDAVAAARAGGLALAWACARGHPRALAAFDAELIPVAAAAIRGMRAASPEVDELLQRLRAHLLVGEDGAPPRIVDYAGRGDLARWVKATAVRTYLNQLRGGRREVPVADDRVFDDLARPEADPELAYLKRRYRAELRAAFRDAVADLSPTEKNVLRFRHVDGLTVEEIAAVERVHRGTVHRRLADVRAKLARRTEALLRARLALTAAEYDSLCRLVDSQLDWSIANDLAG